MQHGISDLKGVVEQHKRLRQGTLVTLAEYRKKRDFARTSEPEGEGPAATDEQMFVEQMFVVQRHAARRLHYDLRLELDGVLKSWAVPKGPSLDPEVKTLAVHVEDHPLDYADFEGLIPAGQYGGGTVMLFDRGRWEPLEDPREGYRRGRLKFRLHGQRLKGSWNLVRAGGRTADPDQWLLIKRKDKQARPGDGHQFVEQVSQSIATGRTMDEIARQADRVWTHSAADNQGDSDGSAVNDPLAPSPQPRSAPGARRGPMPDVVHPQLPTLVDSPPEGESWLHELKYDGYRLLSFKDGNSVRLMTRREHDWTGRFPTVAAAIQQLPANQLVLDGEVVVFARDGTTDFQTLQNSLQAGGFKRHVYLLFDVIYFDGFDLAKTPLEARKQLLAQLLQQHAGPSRVLRYSDHIRGQGPAVHHQTCRHGAEGVVSKRSDSIYSFRRSRSWLKCKCRKRQEFVILGYTSPQGSRNHFGALLLGYYDAQGRLVYCGRVGTGFTERSLAQMGGELRARHADRPSLAHPAAVPGRGEVQWVRPELVAEVEFAEWTDAHHIRQASFQGLRDDKAARAVHRETPAHAAPNGEKPAPATSAERQRDPTASARSTRNIVRVAGIRITNPDKVLYREQGVTKTQLARYYDQIADWILPHVEDRPLSIVRCPHGWQEKCFFQKHYSEGISRPIHSIRIDGENGPDQFLGVSDRSGLVMLAQLGVLEIHPWGARHDRLDRPDRLIFDLDPDAAVPWEQVVDAARLMRQQLERLDLASFVRSTGGKGLHVVVPLQRRSDWTQVKAFARSMARRFTRRWPERFVATASRAGRRGKIYVDYLRNSRGATAIASYSTRARRGATVAMPLAWDELNAVRRPDGFRVDNVPARLAALSRDPWNDFFRVQQSLTKARLRALGVE